MQITDKTAVIINYELKNDEGEILDKSDKGDFAYLHGAKNLIPGLENALSGKSSGDLLEVTVEPADAYGEIEPSRMQTVDRGVFPEGSDIQVGAQFHGAGPNGEPVAVSIAEIDGDKIVIDGNHALAGKTLHFSIEVIEVRAATDDELSHGHIHGETCNH